MTKFFPYSVVVALCCAGLSACGSDDEKSSTTEEVTTAKLYPQYVLSSKGDGTTLVEASFHANGKAGSAVDLAVGESVVATVEGKTRELKLGTDHTYAQTFEYDDPGVTYVIGLLRGTLGDAPFSTVIPPALFELSPVADATSRGAALELSWEPAGTGNVHYTVTGTCLKGLEADAPDSGSLTIAAAALQASAVGGTCDAALTISRTNEGHLDTAFSVGGGVEARQLRSVTFSSTP